MDIQARKLNFIQEFLRIDSEELINKLDKYLHAEKRKIYEKELQPMSHEHFEAMIAQAEDDAKNNRVVDAKILRTEIDKWK